MRILPLITAILVTAFLFFLIIERDALLAFARGQSPDETAAANIDAANSGAADDATDPETTLVSVVAQHSKARVIDSAVILRGQTEAARQVEVRAETSGLVVSEPLRKGAFVEQGQVLCRLDPGTRGASLAEAHARLSEAEARVPEAESQKPRAEAQLETARAQLETARAQLAEVRINYNAAVKLAEDGYASDTRVAAAEASMRAAEAGVTSAGAGVKTAQAGVKTAQSGVLSSAAAIQAAQAGVAAAEKEISRLEIHAPFEGLLESDTAELGALMQPGGLCATILQLDPVKVVGFVPETEIGRVEVGALAGARLTTGQEVRGRVTFLSRSADPLTRTFRVEVEVPNRGLEIRDGQTAEILIASDGASAHLLPQSALTLNDQGVLGVRTVDADHLVKFVAVTLMRDTTEGVWLTGLPETADVIVIGQEYVIDGVKVNPHFNEAEQ